MGESVGRRVRHDGMLTPYLVELVHRGAGGGELFGWHAAGREETIEETPVVHLDDVVT